MKLPVSLSVAAISAALIALPAGTARRPRYGGTLRIEVGGSLSSLDPAVAAASPEEAAAKKQLDALLYDHRHRDQSLSGTSDPGPFRIAEWEPGKHATLAANDGYSGGRPFVDWIEVRMGRSARDRLVDLEVNKTDFAEIAVEQARRASERGVRVSTSEPDELLAIVFVAGRPAAEDARIRQAIARSIDRAAMVNFILQKEGEAAGGLLPQWSNGTAFLFTTDADASGARELWSQIHGSLKIVLGYDSGDALEQAIAERIVVNAREAGISLAPEPVMPRLASSLSAKPDARLIRLRMPSPHPRAALASFLAATGPLSGFGTTSPLPDLASPQQIYDLERTVVGSYRVIPLVWLPQVYGLSSRVRDFQPPAAGGSWPLADVWLEGESK
jgi:hypothetical protein